MSEEKSNIGSIQIKGGKATIVVNKKGDTEPFNIDFVINKIKNITVQNKYQFRYITIIGLKPYTQILKEISINLKKNGLTAIPKIKEELEPYDKETRVGQYNKMISGWLKNLDMFKNIKTTAEEPKNNQEDKKDETKISDNGTDKTENNQIESPVPDIPREERPVNIEEPKPEKTFEEKLKEESVFEIYSNLPDDAKQRIKDADFGYAIQVLKEKQNA